MRNPARLMDTVAMGTPEPGRARWPEHLPVGALRVVRLRDAPYPASGLDQLVFYLPDTVAQERMMARLAAAGVRPVAQIDYWEDNGGVTYQDPDGREVVFASW